MIKIILAVHLCVCVSCLCVGGGVHAVIVCGVYVCRVCVWGVHAVFVFVCVCVCRVCVWEGVCTP